MDMTLVSIGHDSVCPLDNRYTAFVHGYFTVFLVSHPLSKSYLTQSVNHPQSIIRRAEKNKTAKYKQMAIENHATIKAFAVDTLGVLGESAIEVIQQIAKSAEENYSGHSFGETLQSLFCAVAIVIQRGNALVMDQYYHSLQQHYSKRSQQQFQFNAPIYPNQSRNPNNMSSLDDSCSSSVRVMERNNSFGLGVPAMLMSMPRACA